MRYTLLISFLAILSFPIRDVAEVKESMRWFIQIQDDCQNEFSKQLIDAIAKELDGKKFIVTEQGKIVLSEQNEESTYYSRIHSFWMFNEDIQPEQGVGKVLVYFNPKNTDGEYNANFLLYIYQNDAWKRVLNPGNFRFQKELQQAELQTRISQLIIGLTFK